MSLDPAGVQIQSNLFNILFSCIGVFVKHFLLEHNFYFLFTTDFSFPQKVRLLYKFEIHQNEENMFCFFISKTAETQNHFATKV